MEYPNLEPYDTHHHMRTQQINKLAESIKPVQRATHGVPEEHERIGTQLAEEIGLPATAFVMNVSHHTVSRWVERRKIREKSASLVNPL